MALESNSIGKFNKKKFNDFGKICWLWSMADDRRRWTVDIQVRTILPAIDTGQYKIVEADGVPVCYCAWAFLDLETEAHYVLDPSAIELAKWQSGDRLWFIDWVSPFSKSFTWRLQGVLAEMFPDRVARAVRVRPDSEKAKVVHFPGKKLSKYETRKIKENYYSELKQMLTK